MNIEWHVFMGHVYIVYLCTQLRIVGAWLVPAGVVWSGITKQYLTKHLTKCALYRRRLCFISNEWGYAAVDRKVLVYHDEASRQLL